MWWGGESSSIWIAVFVTDEPAIDTTMVLDRSCW